MYNYRISNVLPAEQIKTRARSAFNVDLKKEGFSKEAILFFNTESNFETFYDSDVDDVN